LFTPLVRVISLTEMPLREGRPTTQFSEEQKEYLETTIHANEYMKNYKALEMQGTSSVRTGSTSTRSDYFQIKRARNKGQALFSAGPHRADPLHRYP